MRLLLLFLTLLALAGCGPDYDHLVQERQAYALANQGDIVIVAIEESWTKTFLNGARLAVEEINARPGKLLGRPLRLEIRQGSDEFSEARGTVLDIVKDPKVTAVIGHRRAEIAIPASVIYEASQVIFLSPLSTGNDLTTHRFNFTFRMVPSNTIMAGQLASVAKQMGYKNAALLYSIGYSRRELAFLFEEAAIEQGIKFVARRSFDANDPDYRDLISQFSGKVDMVFLSTDTKSGGRMIRQLREMGVDVPVMGGTQLNLSSIADAAGAAGDHTIVPIFYNPDSDNALNRHFVAAYRDRYGDPPDQYAAQGYDSVRLVADAVAHAKSTLPALVSTNLHYMPYWQGVTGLHTFDARGDLIGKKYLFQVLQGGKWQQLPGVHLPYFLSRFEQILRANDTRMGPPPPFAALFTHSLPNNRLRVLQLDLLHEILGFSRLGLIYGEDGSGKEPEKITLARNLAQKRGFAVDTCGVAVRQLDPDALENRLLECYGSLSLRADALNLVGLDEVNRESLARLQRPLTEYRIPVLTLSGDVELDDGVAIRIGKFGDKVDLESERYINMLEGMLNGIKVYQLAENMENLPVLRVNLGLLNQYGLLRSSPLLQLSPDAYLEWKLPDYDFKLTNEVQAP